MRRRPTKLFGTIVNVDKVQGVSHQDPEGHDQGGSGVKQSREDPDDGACEDDIWARG